MKIDNAVGSADKSTVIPETQILCTECGTTEHLIIETIQFLSPKRDGWVAMEYSCGSCESFYAHEASFQAIATFLAEADEQSGVLTFGRHYIHCGQPMEEAGMTISGIGVDEDEVTGMLYIRIPTIVLRCHCGFQMAIPK